MFWRTVESGKIWQSTCSLDSIQFLGIICRWGAWVIVIGDLHTVDIPSYANESWEVCSFVYHMLQTRQDIDLICTSWFIGMDLFEMCRAQDVSPCSLCWVVWTSNRNPLPWSSTFALCAEFVMIILLAKWPMKQTHIKQAWQVGTLLLPLVYQSWKLQIFKLQTFCSPPFFWYFGVNTSTWIQGETGLIFGWTKDVARCRANPWDDYLQGAVNVIQCLRLIMVV